MKSLAILLVFASAVAVAGEKHDDFHSIVKRVEQYYGKKHQFGALMGVVGFASHFTRPLGASDFKIAIIDEVDAGEGPAPEFKPGPEWSPVIRTTTRHGENTVIFSRVDGHAVRTLMVVLDRDSAVVMQMRFDPTHFAKFVTVKSRVTDGDSERSDER